MDVTDQVAVITGGASGLGLATARRLRDRGARVVVVDLPGTPATDALATEPDLTFAGADVRSEDQVAAALDAAAELGDLRVVVNCAGVAEALKVVSKHSPHPLNRFERVLAINVVGTFNVIRLATEPRSARSAASWSTPPRSLRSTDRSARPPIRRRRAQFTR